ncbi:hypothetical protein vseg_018031 [Gypsophila vaccaria]
MEFIKISFLLITVTTFATLQTLFAAQITLDLRETSKQAYSDFLTGIRNNVEDKNLKYGGTDIPVIGAPTQTYLRINLLTTVGNVSLGLLRSDIYVMAYMAKNDQQRDRVYSFGEKISPSELDKLFPEAKGAANQQKITEYGESYASLEAAGITKVKKAGLGVSKIISYIRAVSGQARQVPNEAKFLLVALQMVSEASRFGYIENMVLNHFPSGFTPDDKVIILEKNWGTISQNIKASEKGVFRPPIVYTDSAVTTTWRVTKVNELNVRLLKYCGK